MINIILSTVPDEVREKTLLVSETDIRNQRIEDDIEYLAEKWGKPNSKPRPLTTSEIRRHSSEISEIIEVYKNMPVILVK